VVVATATPWSEGKIVSDHPSNVLVPVSGKLEPHVRVRPDAVLLSWRPVGGPTKVFYRVLRSGRLGCLYVSTSGSRDCEIDMTTAGFTRHTKYVDRWPPSGGNTYRIGVYAGWTGRLRDADLLLVGPPVTVEVS